MRDEVPPFIMSVFSLTVAGDKVFRAAAAPQDEQAAGRSAERFLIVLYPQYAAPPACGGFNKVSEFRDKRGIATGTRLVEQKELRYRQPLPQPCEHQTAPLPDRHCAGRLRGPQPLGSLEFT